MEPCNHHGRTPPCTEALIDAGIAEVVIGMHDPNPAVNGGGAQRLRDAGVNVEFAEDSSAFREQNEAWLKWLATGRPWVRVKTALTLDGHPALALDERTTLTGAGALGLTMRLRAEADAVVVGAHTARVDDPSLTVRDAAGEPAARQPMRVVLARNAVPDVRLFSDGAGRAVALIPTEWAGEAPQTAESITYDGGEGITGALKALADRGVVSVLVEAGAGMLTALWETGHIDELVLYHAGGMAGADAPVAFYGKPTVSDGVLEHRMRPRECAVLGDDIVTVWRPRIDTDA